MTWNKHLTQLNDALSVLLPFREDVLPYLAQAGISPSQIRFDPKPANLWFSILEYADRNGYLNKLVNALIDTFPNNPHLLAYRSQTIYDIGIDINTVPWKENLLEPQLEKILGRTSTLLPIHFLSEGLEAAKCVVRIVLPTHLGSGFLIGDNLIVTNNHVLADKNQAANASIQFDYEEIKPGHPKSITTFTLDPESVFITSVPDDYTIVKVAEDANKYFGSLNLQATRLEKGSYVNIIQHPGGSYKQIGLYRNILTYADEHIVQYLTDTEPGSSGSPVFNSKWEVVALHNSSGLAKEVISSGTYLRNQGINIKKIIEAIKTI